MTLQSFRPWFYAAAVYNLLWGGVNVFFPKLLFQLVGMAPPNILPLWQVVGMMVLAYAPAYWWAARRPETYPHFIVIGLLGKTLGPIGFVWAFLTLQLPASFGWTIVFNDLIWLPAFALYVRLVGLQRGGLAGLFSGD